MTKRVVNFFINETPETTSKSSPIVEIFDGELLQLEVTTSATAPTNYSIGVKANVLTDSDTPQYFPVSAMGDSSYELTQSINAAGLYKVSTVGYNKIQLTLGTTSTQTGTVTVRGIIIGE